MSTFCHAVPSFFGALAGGINGIVSLQRLKYSNDLHVSIFLSPILTGSTCALVVFWDVRLLLIFNLRSIRTFISIDLKTEKNGLEIVGTVCNNNNPTTASSCNHHECSCTAMFSYM